MVGTLMTITLTRAELVGLCTDALLAAGADQPAAARLAEAIATAEFVGNPAVGVRHLFDYATAYAEGRIAVGEEPVVRRAGRAVIDIDARDGLAQTAFGAALDEFQVSIRDCGIAALWIRNSFTCGELGDYPRTVATAGFIAVAAANSPAYMSLGGAPRPVLGTNPLAYAIPRPGQLPIVIDQASSSTAFVNIRRAAAEGTTIPAGWALGPEGEATEDPAAALLGTLLPFGGHRGGNVALLVELLATLSGGDFSLDAAPFDQGGTSPRIGVFVLGIDPTIFGDAAGRLLAHMDRLRDEHGVRLPAVELTELPDRVELTDDLHQRLLTAARPSVTPPPGIEPDEHGRTNRGGSHS